MKLHEIILRRVKEQATAGATSAGNIATLNSPHVAAGDDRFKKSTQEHQENLVQKHQNYLK